MDIAEIKAKLKNRSLGIIDTKRANAVLIPLIRNEDGVCILFETRSQNVWQPGEVCFPGGGIEQGETAEDAAIRECCEELGIKKDDIEIIAQFDKIFGLGGFVITPFIGELNTDSFCINENEVSDIFTVPLWWFMDNDPSCFEFPMTVNVPEDFDYSVFGIKGPYDWRKTSHNVAAWKYKNHYIWGLTAKFMLHLVEALRENE